MAVECEARVHAVCPAPARDRVRISPCPDAARGIKRPLSGTGVLELPRGQSSCSIRAYSPPTSPPSSPRGMQGSRPSASSTARCGGRLRRGGVHPKGPGRRRVGMHYPSRHGTGVRTAAASRPRTQGHQQTRKSRPRDRWVGAGRGQGGQGRTDGTAPPAAVGGQIRTPQVPDGLAVKAAGIATRRGAPAQAARLPAAHNSARARGEPPNALPAQAARLPAARGRGIARRNVRWLAGRPPAGARPPRRRRSGRRSPRAQCAPGAAAPQPDGTAAACGNVRRAACGTHGAPASRRIPRCGVAGSPPPAGRAAPVDGAPAGRGRIYKGATRRRRGPDKAAGEH